MQRRHAIFLSGILVITSFLAGCTSKNDQNDADGDGIPDDVETAGWQIVIHLESGETRRDVKSDPFESDTDGDGLRDGEELTRTNTDPSSPDTDGDGLLDGGDVTPSAEKAEYWRSLGILEDPAKPGTFLGEDTACDGGRASPIRWDSDQPITDGISDGVERMGWSLEIRGETRTFKTSVCGADTDSDGIHDGEERRRGSDPTMRDTDGDGITDNIDGDPQWNLALRVIVETVTLKQTKDIPPGADFVFALDSAGTKGTGKARVNELNKAISVNVPILLDIDDTGGAWPDHWVSVSFTVTDDDGATGSQPIAIAGATNVAAFEVNVPTVAYKLNGTEGSTRLTLDGDDATVVLRFETVKT